MISFLVCLALLIGGYFVYGNLVNNIFSPDDRETPAVRINDGVDYVVMPQWKLFLIQLLNIAGLGPIFGAMQGALWGPIVFLWITFGTIFAGAVHDYFSGMMSERNEGASISEISGIYLGGAMKNVMRVFSVVLLVMVGTVFAVGPAGLIVKLCSEAGASGILLNASFWLTVVLIYYFIATFISIDKIIGKIYPVFGVCLIIMAVGVGAGIVIDPAYQIPELWDHFTNMHPKGTPIWAFMFITVACGAISGFHATQSPLRARCMTNEKQGRRVFYGAMITEGVLGLIWATLALSFYPDAASLSAAMGPKGAPTVVVQQIAITLLGPVGGLLAILGVVLLPISTGDTAFRAARGMLADRFHIDQKNVTKRILTAVPLFCGGVALTLLDFPIIWRYFGWANQTMSCVSLWAFSVWLARHGRLHWITSIPAVFMTTVCTAYICYAPIGFRLSMEASTIIGIVVSLSCLALFLHFCRSSSMSAAKPAACMK